MIKTLWLIYGILRWHKRTFPNATAEQQEQKLAEEIREYDEAIDRFIKTNYQRELIHIKEELADVAIAAVNLLRYPEMQELVKNKMTINRRRIWQKGQHI